jgi:hypothetical protein
MTWGVTDVTVSLVSPTQATVQFDNIGDSGLSVGTIKVAFQLSPVPPNITKEDMIARAQQFLIEAGNSAVQVSQLRLGAS